MHTLPTIRKIFQGVAARHEMYRMFNRHRGDPAWTAGDAAHLFAGEWFEIAEAEHDYMFEILPPLFLRGDLFALREFMTGSVTSIFFALAIDGRRRWFHGYCDLSDRDSPERMKAAIIERESRPVRGMTRDERLEHIWSSTHDDYRGYAGERWLASMRGRRTVLVYAGRFGTVLKLLDELTDAEIAAKLPVQLRHLPETIAA
ncbi:hypothetical protein CWS35_37395 (plasmid) [Bradyrhizobium sp. SK17]|uniref:DUF1419 domain-containing protein n=1 Tax=Bradyrhizobium sp. SK17 TaxID=2057741 RepID=UPI000C30CC9A|nr:DUF1419 domain-containing protein [Bradyrhizobium sp. SK17]AUD00106.1 hypothetical protein CWS35_37395 [Bradyrhizobium sp. SK17]MBN8978649.1 DUF1419 domain-containing protein [Hyphomicrobiales bacterium]